VTKDGKELAAAESRVVSRTCGEQAHGGYEKSVGRGRERDTRLVEIGTQRGQGRGGEARDGKLYSSSFRAGVSEIKNACVMAKTEGNGRRKWR